MKLHEFGTLYIQGASIKNPERPSEFGDIPQYNKGSIILGDTKPGMEIHWIELEELGILVSDRIILNKVNVDTLNTMGFLSGRKVFIDGVWYKCRLLKDYSEWEDCLLFSNDSDSLWHYSKIYTILARQEHPDAYSVVGYDRARAQASVGKISRVVLCGFRPVLEPLTTKGQLFGRPFTLEGQQFCLVDIFACESSTQFLPTLYAMDGTNIDRKPFAGIPDKTVIRMYSLLMDGEPVPIYKRKVCGYKKGCSLTLTDRFYGEKYLIPWVVDNGKAVAARTVLSNISRDELRKQGFLGDI